MRQVPSTPRHHVRGCPAGPRSGVGVLRSRLRQPYRWRQPRSPIPRREEGGIGGLRIGRRWRQGRNPAGQDESRDQDSDHGWSIPWRSGLRCAARRAASALPATCASRRRLPPAFYSEVAEGVGFEPTRERNPLLVFKTSALNHSAILPSHCLHSVIFKAAVARNRRLLPFGSRRRFWRPLAPACRGLRGNTSRA